MASADLDLRILISTVADGLDQISSINDSLNNLAGIVEKVAFAYAGFISLASLKEAADIAARNETLGKTLEIVGNNANYTSEQLKSYETELRGLGITTAGARNSMIQMMQAGLQLGPAVQGSASQISQLARAAQDLAVVTGENSSDTLQRLITNIQQMDTVGLRFMGITVSMDDAMKNYAQSIGKTAGALTRAERQQAVYNAVMEEASKLSGAYESSLDTVGKQLSSMSRYQEEAAASIGEILLPAYGELVRYGTEFLKSTQEIAQGLADSGKMAEFLQTMMRAALEVGKGIVEAFSALFAPITDSAGKAFEQFKQAFSGIEEVVTPLKESVVNTFSAIGEQVAKVVEVIGGAADAFKRLFGSVVELFTSISNAVGSIFSLGDAFTETKEAAGILSYTLDTIGFFLAAVADGVDILAAALQGVASVALIAFGGVAHAIGSLVGLFNEELGNSIKGVGDKMWDMANKAAEAAGQTFQNFADGNTHMQKYQDNLEKVKNSQEEYNKKQEESAKQAEKQGEVYQQLSDKVSQFAQSIKDGIDGGQAKEGYKQLREEIIQLGEAHDISEKQVQRLIDRLDGAANKTVNLDEAYKALKTSAQELISQTSEAGSQAVSAFNEIANSGSYAADEIYRAFSKALNLETSLAGLTSFREALDAAFQGGKISIEEFESALQLLKNKFDETFSKSLNAAKTKEDFVQLREVVIQLGESGAISLEKMEDALNAIDKASSNAAQSMKNSLDSAKQATEIAKQKTSITKQEIDYARALEDVEDAKAKLIQAEIKDRQKSTDLTRAEVREAQKNLEVQKQRAALVKLNLDRERAGLDLLIAKQKQLNAERAKADGVEGAEKAAIAAEKEVNSRELALESLNKSVAQQEQVVAKTEAAASAAKKFADNMRESAQQASAAASQAEKASSSLSSSGGKSSGAQGGFSFKTLKSEDLFEQFKGVGLSEVDAKKKLDEVRDFWVKGQGLLADALRSALVGKGFKDHIHAKEIMAEVKKEISAADAEVKRLNDSWKETLATTSDNKEAVVDVGNYVATWGVGAERVAAAYQEIREQAIAAREEAKSSAEAFINSALAIRQEVLQAEGKEEEVAKQRYAQRRKELDLEYQMLQIKLKSAVAQGKAAGTDTSELTKLIEESTRSYNQAKADLGKLEKKDIEEIAKKREEQKKREQENLQRERERKEKELQREQEQKKREEERAAKERERQHDRNKERQGELHQREEDHYKKLRELNEGDWRSQLEAQRELSKIAEETSRGLLSDIPLPAAQEANVKSAKDKAPDATPPEKKVEVNIRMGNKAVRVEADESNQAKLVDLLGQLQGISS